MRILFAILTTSDVERLYRCVKCVENQRQFHFDYDIKIVVNTQDKEYASKVRERIWAHEIIETPSNGLPGKGKNSVFDLFEERADEYDYMFVIDGDDYLYPWATEQIAKALETEPDILGIQAMDLVKYAKTDVNDVPILCPGFTPKLFVLSWQSNEANIHEMPEFPWIDNPEFDRIALWTPDRPTLFSRKFIREHRINFPEHLTIFEDYSFSLQAFARSVESDLRYQQVNNSYIYAYDRTNTKSICAKFDKWQDPDFRRVFNRSYDHVMPVLKKHHIRELPFRKLGNPENISMKDKVRFLGELHYAFPGVEISPRPFQHVPEF